MSLKTTVSCTVISEANRNATNKIERLETKDTKKNMKGRKVK